MQTDRITRNLLSVALLSCMVLTVRAQTVSTTAKSAGAGAKATPTPELKAWVPPAPKEGLAKQLSDLVGGRRVKVIWTRGYRDTGGPLMGFDTEEGKERVIVPAPAVCCNPWFSLDGNRILYSSVPAEQTSYVVDWDGKNLRKFISGRHFYIFGLWRDPATGTDWVYVSDATSKEADAELAASGSQVTSHTALSIYRYKLDDPSVRELVWNKAPVGIRTTISADGSMLVGEFPWPNCGLATVPNGTFRMIGQGCNANLAPDGSGLFFNLIGDHRTLTMYDKAGTAKAKISINTMPGNEKDPKRAVWRPRWSNEARLFTVQSADNGPDADVCVGEFNETFTGVKNWVRVTDTTDYDGNTLAWVEAGATSVTGAKLTDNLTVTLLKDAVVRLEMAKQVLPLAIQLDALALNTADAARSAEARKIIAHVQRWCDIRLAEAQAMESSDPAGADQLYRMLYFRFNGMTWAKKAEERLRDPALARQIRAWPYYERILKSEKDLREVKDAAASTQDKKWMMRNQMYVLTMMEAARALKQNYADSVAWEKAQQVLARYDISLERKTH